MKISQRIYDTKIMPFLFFLVVVANNTFGSDAEMYFISKMIILMFLITTFAFMFFQKKIILKKNIVWVFSFMALELISVVWSYDKGIAIGQLQTQIQLFLLFLAVYFYVDKTQDVESFYKATYFSGYTLALYSIYVYGVNGFLKLLIEGNRMGGEIANENTFGMVFALSFITAFYFMLRGSDKSLILSKLHVVSMGVFGFFAFSSGSKKAFLIIIFGVVGISVTFYGIRKIWKVFLILMVAAFILVNIMQLDMFSTINERLTSFLSGDLNVSDQIRATYMETGLKLIWDKPLFGYGLRNFGSVTGFGTYSHNNYIELGVSLGITGVIIYYIPIITSFIKLLKLALEKNKETILLLLFVSVNIIFGYGMVQYYEKDTWILIAVTMGTLNSKYNNKNVRRSIDEHI